MMTPILVEIMESSQVGETRRLGQKLAVACGLDSVDEGRVSLIITEAATNIVRYGTSGLMILQICKTQDLMGVEILALDRGPGMRDVASCLVDGYSTGGTQGSGLGAIRRLSDVFDIYSAPGQGTAILCRVFPRSSKSELAKGPATVLTWGAISLPYPGEDVCGDIWAAHADDNRGLFLVADGLGHGLGAADAAREAAGVFQRESGWPPVPVLERCHDALRKTRGAAAAIAEVDLDQSIVRYTGIGNIVSSVTTRNGCHHMVSHSGILGHSARKFQEFSYPWEKDSILVMQSDGLSTRSDLSPYPGLIVHDPTLIAGVLFRDFRRGRDDATIIVVRAVHPYSELTEWTVSCSM
jgi:anti-sigma regulatory factor (Ser/Thr protein kinase)